MVTGSEIKTLAKGTDEQWSWLPWLEFPGVLQDRKDEQQAPHLSSFYYQIFSTGIKKTSVQSSEEKPVFKPWWFINMLK